MNLREKVMEKISNYENPSEWHKDFMNNLKQIRNFNYFSEVFDNKDLVLIGNGYLFIGDTFENIKKEMILNNFIDEENRPIKLAKTIPYDYRNNPNYMNIGGNIYVVDPDILHINNGPDSNGIYISKETEHPFCSRIEKLFNLEKDLFGCWICAPGGANPIHKNSNIGKLLEKYVGTNTPLFTKGGYVGPIKLKDKNSWEMESDFDNHVCLINGIKL